jgi:hypothetical protein
MSTQAWHHLERGALDKAPPAPVATKRNSHAAVAVTHARTKRNVHRLTKHSGCAARPFDDTALAVPPPASCTTSLSTIERMSASTSRDTPCASCPCPRSTVATALPRGCPPEPPSSSVKAEERRFRPCCSGTRTRSLQRLRSSLRPRHTSATQPPVNRIGCNVRGARHCAM